MESLIRSLIHVTQRLVMSRAQTEAWYSTLSPEMKFSWQAKFSLPSSSSSDECRTKEARGCLISGTHIAAGKSPVQDTNGPKLSHALSLQIQIQNRLHWSQGARSSAPEEQKWKGILYVSFIVWALPPCALSESSISWCEMVTEVYKGLGQNRTGSWSSFFAHLVPCISSAFWLSLGTYTVWWDQLSAL